ncbi:MAG: hypothetical protein KKD39_02095, partial [Candidatus Altiarchaeota archaeon]|nr:hypothetical protein [Candidatus Altiarchaeota archaeon]
KTNLKYVYETTAMETDNVLYFWVTDNYLVLLELEEGETADFQPVLKAIVKEYSPVYSNEILTRQANY